MEATSTKCDSMESLLEEEILQTNIHSLKICDCSFSDPRAKLVYPLCCNHYQSLTVPKWTLFYQSCSDAITLYLKIYQSMVGLEKLCISISEGDPISLLNLEIRGCHNLVYIQLPALDSMDHEISSCSKLRLLVHTHSSLRKLILRDCSEFLFHREGLPSNLRELEVCRCNQLTSQVDWDLQRLTSLTKLTIKGGCEDVELFPKECLLPSSLTYISISDLPNLKSLYSRGLQRLTSLLQLEIRNCTELQFSIGVRSSTPYFSQNIILVPKAPILNRSRSSPPYHS